jgi:hypothetical protein
MYGCAWCGRTPKAEDRAKCWKCMADGKTGQECAEPFGVLPYDGTKKL